MKGITIIIMFVGPFVLYYCLRSVAVRAVLFFMMRGHSAQQAVPGPPAPEPATGQAKGSELSVENLDLGSEIVLAEPQEKRWRGTQKMGSKTLMAFAAALVPGVLVLTITEYIGFSTGGTRDPNWASTVFLYAAIWGVVLFLGAVACRIRAGMLTRLATATLMFLGSGLIIIAVSQLQKDKVSAEAFQSHFLAILLNRKAAFRSEPKTLSKSDLVNPRAATLQSRNWP